MGKVSMGNMIAETPTSDHLGMVEPISWLMAARSATRSTIVVGITLLSFQAHTQSSRYWVSIGTIAKSAGVGVRAAQRALKDLVGLGLVDVIQNPGYEHTIVLCDASRRLAPATDQSHPQPHHPDSPVVLEPVSTGANNTYATTEASNVRKATR